MAMAETTSDHTTSRAEGAWYGIRGGPLPSARCGEDLSVGSHPGVLAGIVRRGRWHVPERDGGDRQVKPHQFFRDVYGWLSRPYFPTSIRVLRDWGSGPDDHIYVHTRCRAFASARIHTFGLDHCGGGGSRQVGDERLGGCR